ncbi:MAG: GAF domain-containing protein [Anaerolineae bacterium]|nr:GAF domain-containing protein [Anaerolineae bacterium]
MRERILRYIRISDAYDDANERQQAQRLLTINAMWLGTILAVLPLLLWWLLDSFSTDNIDAATLFVPVTLALALLTHRLIQRGWQEQARILFVTNIMAVSLLTIFPDYRMDTPFIIVLLTPLTAAGVLLRRSGLLVVALTLAVAVVVGGVFQVLVDMEPTPAGITALEGVRTTIIILLAVGFINSAILWVFKSGIQYSLQQQRMLSELLGKTAQTSQTLTAIHGSDEALTFAVEQLRDTFGLYHAQVYLADPDSGLAVLKASTGFIGRRLLEEDSLLLPDEYNLVNDALRQIDPILIDENMSETQRTSFLPATRSELLLPLRVGDRLPFGVLDLHSATPDTFTPVVLDALRAIANHMAMVLHSGQQVDELNYGRQEHDRLTAQIEATRRDLARLNRQLVGATWGVYLEERMGMTTGFDWHQGRITSPESVSTVLNETVTDGQARLEQRGDRQVLCVPIHLRGQLLGAIEFSKTGDRRWVPYALELAQAVADRLALSLENVRLFEQAQMTAQREQLVSQVTSHLQTSNDLHSLLATAASQFQKALGATQTQIRLGSVHLDNTADEAEE